MLRLDGLARRPMVQGVSLALHAGEVLGLGGLVGAGRSDLARLIFGVDRPDAGSMALEGRRYAPRTPAAALRAGVGLVPEERRADGLLLTKSVAFNLSLANLGKVVFSPALPLVRAGSCAASPRTPSARWRSRRRGRGSRWDGCRAAISRRW